MTAASLPQIRDLRLQGQLAAAIEGLMSLHDDGAYRELMLEACILALLNAQADKAEHIYLELLAGEYPDFELPLELSARLALKSPDRIPLPVGTVAINAPAWVTHLMRSGSDRLYDLDIREVQIECVSSVANYRFTAACGACRHAFSFWIHTSLLLEREGLCPACLAQHVIRPETVWSFFEALWDRHGTRLQDLDHLMLAELRSISIASEDPSNVPILSQYFNQDYLYLLSQCVLEHARREPARD